MTDINPNPTHTAFSRSEKLAQLTFRYHPKNILKSGDPGSKNIGSSREQEEFVGLVLYNLHDLASKYLKSRGH